MAAREGCWPENVNGLSSEEGERSGPVEAFNGGVVADEAQ
jgi:hypothetical protein